MTDNLLGAAAVARLRIHLEAGANTPNLNQIFDSHAHYFSASALQTWVNLSCSLIAVCSCNCSCSFHLQLQVTVADYCATVI